MRRVLVLRPEAEAAQTAARLVAEGFSPVLSPLLRMVDVAVDASVFHAARAIILTSPYGLREAMPIAPGSLFYCVGERAAQKARALGYCVAQVAKDSAALAELLDSEAEGGEMLYLSAREVQYDFGQMRRPVRRVVSYEACDEAYLAPQALAALGETGPLSVLLTSQRITKLFLQLLPGDSCATLRAVCLSPAIADCAKAGGITQCFTAAAPDEESLIAALHTSC